MNSFKAILRKFIADNEISQEVISLQIGDSQQAISDFLKKDSKPQEKTRQKYLEHLKGFKAYYNTNKLQVNINTSSKKSTTGKLSEAHKQIISQAFLMHEAEVKEIFIVKKVISAERLDAENAILREINSVDKKE